MNPSIRKILWSVFGALFLFVVLSVALNLTILFLVKKQQDRTIEFYEPLLEALLSMDRDITSMLAAARGYAVTQQTQFESNYLDAIREFQQHAAAARTLATSPADRTLVAAVLQQFETLRRLCDEQIEATKEQNSRVAIEKMVEEETKQRAAPDFSSAFARRESARRDEELRRLDDLRLVVTLLLIFVSLSILAIGALSVLKLDQSLERSITRQVKRTETIIGGMADGVMLVDGLGKVVFINPAGQRMLGKTVVGVPIEQQARVYGLKTVSSRLLDASEIPAAQALSTNRPVKDVTVVLSESESGEITVSMSAVPLLDDGKIGGVIVTFRDVTERRRLEEQMKIQAERAQILADAGAFFASNIDPVWVTQAIVERVAEALGDWAAVILKSPVTNELQVAALYHRDMASLGLAWSYIYRQPLVLGEGIIGQVISSGYPSLTTNLSPGGSKSESSTYHPAQMKLSSLLVLPMQTRRAGILGALVIAANDPDRQMTDEKLPLAELLAERAALAIENAKLYTEQVEARRKLEDVSRLKDEFLSIASHELRTPVTSIKGYTQLAKALITEGDLGTSGEYLEIALDQIDRMSRLILELLDVSRIETGRLEIRREPIDWTEFVADVVSHHHAIVGERRITLDLPSSHKRVEGDRDRLEQVLGNLLENAVKYSHEESEVNVTVIDEDDRVLTSVRDSGIGIPDDELNQVFERFHRGRQVSSSNYGGLGLGLYIARQIVERHGGQIWVESVEGQGTTFTFSLPTEKVSSEKLEAVSS